MYVYMLHVRVYVNLTLYRPLTFIFYKGTHTTACCRLNLASIGLL